MVEKDCPPSPPKKEQKKDCPLNPKQKRKRKRLSSERPPKKNKKEERKMLSTDSQTKNEFRCHTDCHSTVFVFSEVSGPGSPLGHPAGGGGGGY